MRVLFVSSFLLFKETRFGGAKRLYYFARELQRHADITLLCFDGCRESGTGQDAAREFGKAVFLPATQIRPWWKKAAFLPAGVREVIAQERTRIEALLGEGRFDATLFAYPPSLCFLDWPWKERLGKMVYLEDDLLLETFRRDAAHAPGWAQRLKWGLRHRQALPFFRRRLRGVDTFVCISPEEEGVVRSLFPGLPTRLLPYGIPLDEFPLQPPPAPADRQVLGFIGNYQHGPNLDALQWLIGELFPYIRDHVPAARLLLGGRAFPADMAARCAAMPGVTVRENLPDLAGFYAGIGVFINPIRQGRGLRTKVVEACAFGRPVLSTALGAEGLQALRLGLCESKEEFLAAFLGMQSAAAYGEAAACNRKVVEREFAIASLGERLAGILAGAGADASPKAC